MLVKDLRDALADMPGEMSVYSVGGPGIASAKHVFRLNLVGVEQFCELRTYFEDHTPDMQDIKIERETGFKTRDELITAYRTLLAASGDRESHGTERPQASPQPRDEPLSLPRQHQPRG